MITAGVSQYRPTVFTVNFFFKYYCNGRQDFDRHKKEKFVNKLGISFLITNHKYPVIFNDCFTYTHSKTMHLESSQVVRFVLCFVRHSLENPQKDICSSVSTNIQNGESQREYFHLLSLLVYYTNTPAYGSWVFPNYFYAWVVITALLLTDKLTGNFQRNFIITSSSHLTWQSSFIMLNLWIFSNCFNALYFNATQILPV